LREATGETMNSPCSPAVPSSVSISDLTTKLLEREPSRYWGILNVLSTDQSLEEKAALKKKLNETSYEVWESNHVFALCRLVGPINQSVKDGEYDIDTWYGSRNLGGIDQDLSVSLFKMMVDCGADILAKDYYENDIVEFLSHPENSVFHRKNNEEFVMVVKSMVVEEGVPP